MSTSKEFNQICLWLDYPHTVENKKRYALVMLDFPQSIDWGNTFNIMSSAFLWTTGRSKR